MTPQTYNRWTAAIATGVFVVISVLLAGLSTQPTTDALRQRPSTFFTDTNGARALFLVVKRFAPAAEQWRRPLDHLPAPGTANVPGTLLVVGPGRPLSSVEARRLDDWLSAGGQLILLTANGWPLRQRAVGNEVDAEKENAEDEAGTWETLLSRYAPPLRWAKPGKFNTGHAAGSSLPEKEIVLGWRRSFVNAEGFTVIAAAGDDVLGVEIPVGRGRILAIADPSMASNYALRRSDNAVWLVSLATAQGGRILFDEYHHGFGQKRGAMELTHAFLMTPWGWCVLQVAAAALLFVFAYRRRFGRIKEPPLPNRASPLELVEARAGVLRVAAAQKLAADLIMQHLWTQLGKARGRSADGGNLELELEKLAKSGDTASPAVALHALFAKIQRNERLTDRQFIELGRAAGEIVKGTKL